MSASLPKRAGRGPPALRIHAGVSRHRASTRGLIACRPLDPASLSPFRGKKPARTPAVNAESFVRFWWIYTIIPIRRFSYE